MTATYASRPQRRTHWELASLALMVAALGVLAYLVVRIIMAWSSGAFAVMSGDRWSFALAIVIYLGGHAFRILRLGMLIGGWRVGLRETATFHLMTAAVGFTVPLKLGEAYRVIELSNLTGGFVRAVLTAWWERAFDVAVIMFILLLAFAATPASANAPFYAIGAAAGLFIVGTAIMFFVAPDNLRRLSLLIIRRYDSPRSIALLRVLHTARSAIQEAPGIVKNKLSSLITLTALIWACEVACFALLFPTVAGLIGSATEQLLSFLSAVTLGETLLTGLNSATQHHLNYLAGTQMPLAIIGLGAGLVYASIRWKRVAK